MRNQKGFTLIELIIVIVVLGILAVTAAPQFINFSSDARKSTVEGLLGSTKAASEIIRGKALVNPSAATVTIDEEDTSVDIANGYAAATSSGIANALDISTDWSTEVAASGWTGNSSVQEDDLVIFPNELTLTDDGSSDPECYVVYRGAVAADSSATPAVSFAKPVIQAVTSGC